jgi:tRNA A37 threonylcarbamoyladenosine dehydratase
LLHAWLLKAMRNVNPAATEEAAWEEIAKAVYWLFHKQRVSGPRFVVQSPDSLRDKWDRIKRCRENSANSSQRGANGRPDPIQKRRWIPADEWGER